MINRQFPDWTSFAYKYRGREQAALEDLARTLFRKKLGIETGLFQRVNHKGNETEVIKRDGKVIGFQAKYFKSEIDAENIIHSMRGAKEENPQQTHYYIYSNQTFGLPRKRKGSTVSDSNTQKTQKEEKIEQVAAELGLTLVWKLDKAILDEANEEGWIYDVFFNVDGVLEKEIQEEKGHTTLVFDNIGYTCQFHGQQIHIPRDKVIERLEELPAGRLYVIHGEGGCGKTAILHELFEKHKEDYPICYRKASVLNVQSLSQVFHRGNPYTMENFRDAYKDSRRKYFIIDSAEHLEDMPDEAIVPSLIRMLTEEEWCVVLTVRNLYVGDLLNFLTLQAKQKNVLTESVELLSEQELTSLARENSIRLSADVNLRDRLRNLFYLNLYMQYYDELGGTKDDQAFLQFIWGKKIRGRDKRKGYIRENEFEKFIDEKVKTGKVFLSPNDYVSEAFYSLIDDEVITLDPDNGLFISHDIFEEWGLYRYVEKAWKQNTSINDFLSTLGENRSTRRMFRIWLKNKVNTDVEKVRPLAKAALSKELPGLWKDEVLCAVLSSDKANLMLAGTEQAILNNDNGLGEKVIWTLRVGCQYIQEIVKLNDFYWPQCVPFGTGWCYVIDLLFRNKDKVNLTPWLPVLQDWTKKTYQSETIRQAGLLALEYYQSHEYESLRYRDGIKNQVCAIINNAAWTIKEELRNLLDRCMTENLTDDLSTFILQENSIALNIQVALPDVVAELCIHYWKEKENEGRCSLSLSRGQGYGIDEDHIASRYFPPGANQTPTMTLLMSNEQVGIDFIIRLMNDCTEHYSQSGRVEYMAKVAIKDESGVKNWQWHSASLWGMYRGMGAVVSYTLQSVHMALEQYLLNLSEHGKYDRCRQLMRRLLFECHSSSVSAVVASLVLAYPNKYWKEAMILFRTVEFIETDNQRLPNESQMEHFYGIGYTLNPSVTEERQKTCEQAFRKKTLENVCLEYQYFGNQQELNEEQGEALIQAIYDILDEHRKMLEGRTDELLEILLSRMDRRRLKVKEQRQVEGGYEIQFETELGADARKVSEDAAVRQQEMFKYLGLQNWAMYKMRGEDISGNVYGDDWKKVIKEAKELQRELSHGRKPYLTDAYTTTWVAACLLKFYSEQLPASELSWCKEVVEQRLTSFTVLIDALDGTTACIHVLPRLITLFPKDGDRYFETMLRCLQTSDYGNNMSSSACVIKAVHTYRLWEEKPIEMGRLLERFVTSMEKDEKNYFVTLKVIAGLVPDAPDEKTIACVVKYLEKIPEMMKRGDRAVQSMFAVEENLARLFMRTESEAILNCLEYTQAIVQESHLGDVFLTRVIIEADNANKPERFWAIWNTYRALFPSMVRFGYGQPLRVYLLSIQWNDGKKEWRCLRKEDISFFDYVADNSNGNGIVMESIARALTNIAHGYQTEGMIWISKIVTAYSSINLANTNTLFYLEQVMTEYVYANKMQIRKSEELHRQVRAILDFMVGKSSVTGYVLRDMVN